ncbi:uncharacterized protein LOC128186562 [Crassostrea angulata]|uniref:uncharacterized protein LOC128186562 n=1 Tax=Magallana angulata TaxID=2784310 RepID=UPI0022B0AAB7|nr:uncharacterized protein LOC128186562 [Crassostrea angulata]
MNMGGHNQNKPHSSSRDESRSQTMSQSNKRQRPNSDTDSSQNLTQDLSDLSSLLENLSNDEETLQQATSIILKNSAFKNNIVDRLAARIGDLEQKINYLETRVDDLEQYSRKNCLKFSGIPEQHNEDTDQVVLNTVNNYILKSTKITLDRYSISNSHRLGPPQGSKSRPRDIIVRFTRYRDRDAVFKNKKNLKSFNTNPTNNYKIFVNEALTRRRALLFKKARATVKTGHASSCWTNDGKIIVKLKNDKKITIRSEEDVDKLSATGKSRHPSYAAAAACNAD